MIICVIIFILDEWVEKMDGNLNYGMESFKVIKNNELIKKLKEKDVHFVQFCLGICGKENAKMEGRVAIQENLLLFLSDLEDIKEIIEDLIKKIEETTDEQEKRDLLKELEDWKQERNSYYKQLAKIEKQIRSKNQANVNGRNYLNDEKAVEYARMIQLITVYDQQKKKMVLDGKTNVSKLEETIAILHSIQDKLNILYQATYGVTDLLEEKDAIPRMRVGGETNEEYEKYLYQFYHQENTLPKIIERKDESVENPTQNEEDVSTVYSDGYDNGLTYSLGEQLSQLDLDDKTLEYDSWLDHLDTFLTNKWVLKTFSYFDEKIENFKKMLYYIQKARESTQEEEYPYQNLYEGLLSNGNYMGELEITKPEEFENEKEILLDNLRDYQTEFEKLNISALDVEFYSKLSSFFEAIYLYEKKKQDYMNHPEEKENLLNIYHFVNNHAKDLFQVENFIPNSDLPFALEESLEENNQYTNIFEIPEDKDDLTIDDFVTSPFPVVLPVSPVEKEVPQEENVKTLNEKEELEKQIEDLKVEKERLLKENEELKLVHEKSQEQIEHLTHEKEELEKEIENLKGKKTVGGKPFRVIREKAHDLWERVNKRNVMYAAIGITSLAMIGAGGIKWFSNIKNSNKNPNESTIKVETVGTPTLANEQIEKMLSMHQKLSEINHQLEQENVKEEVEEISEPMQSLPEEEFYDSYTGPHIGDVVTIDFGANTYTDFLVEKDVNTVNVSTGSQRVFKGNYSPDTEMVVLKVAFINPNDSSKTVIAKSNEEIKRYVNDGYQVLSAAVSLNTSLSSVADGLYETNSKQVDDNITFYVSAQNINQEKGFSR